MGQVMPWINHFHELSDCIREMIGNDLHLDLLFHLRTAEPAFWVISLILIYSLVNRPKLREFQIHLREADLHLE